MSTGRKVLISIALVAFIVVVVVFIAKSATHSSAPPQSVMKEAVEFVDENSQELVTLTRSEMAGREGKDGYYKNPKTGEYTLRRAIVCVACKAKIASPVMPSLPEKFISNEDNMERREKIQAIRSSFKCPKCGKLALQ